MKTRLWIVPALAGAALLGACSDGAGVSDPAERQDPQVEQLVEMGFRRDQIVDRGDHFVVEGDIRVYKKNLRAAPPADGRAHPAGPRYQRFSSTVAEAYRRSITVNLSAVDAVNTSWANATRAAMTNWSSINRVNLVMAETAGPADIVVRIANRFTDNLGSCDAALGTQPANGAPGQEILINPAFMNFYTYAKQVWIMTHEFGHNVGFRHTDQSYGTLVFGTPGSDAGSVMNSGNFYGSSSNCAPTVPDWSSFSSYDQIAAQTLYPLPAPSASVANSGGNPLLSWSALDGVQSYDVHLQVLTRTKSEIINDYRVQLGTTSGTSFLDLNSTYTGVTECSWTDFGVQYYQIHRYSVAAHYPNGGTAATLRAPVATDC